MESAAQLLAETRARHRLDQKALALRAGTSQAQISRLELQKTSPSVGTLRRLLLAMGEQLVLGAQPCPHGNMTTDELRRTLAETTPGERIAEAIELSHLLTGITPSGAKHG